MTRSVKARAANEFDLVGIGVGPANLSLIAALLDARDTKSSPPKAIFLERSPEFAWHPGAMLPGSRIQVPFLKDLVTLRNPRSRYSFLNYLFEAGRLEQFVNLRELFPERDEFKAYMAWIASQAGPLIRYSSAVAELQPIEGACGRIERIVAMVTADDGSVRSYSARTLAVAVGRPPAWPNGVERDGKGRIVHASALLTYAETAKWTVGAQRFLVVGGGQSAIEVACYLLERDPFAHVELCHRSLALGVLDDNPFVNQWFCASGMTSFQALSDEARGRAIQSFSRANFGVADRFLLDRLYGHHYAGIRSGAPRVTFLAGHELLNACSSDGVLVSATARCTMSGQTVTRTVDRLVLATGYEEKEPALLRTLDPWLMRDPEGHVLMDNDYRLRTIDSCEAAVFLQGVGYVRHGPGEPTLSIRAVRAGVLLNAVKRVLARQRPVDGAQNA